MNRFLMLILMLPVAGLVGCEEKTVIETQGTKAAEIYVTAGAGMCSIAVETFGSWHVGELDGADWVHFDVDGGFGNGAFTVYYDSNESDVFNLRLNRMARIVVASSDRFRADTIYFKQAGIPAVLAFQRSEITVDAGRQVCTEPLSTNIPGTAAQVAVQSDAVWIESIAVSPSLSECSFSVAENLSGQIRRGDVTLRFVDEWGETIVAKLFVVQKS